MRPEMSITFKADEAIWASMLLVIRVMHRLYVMLQRPFLGENKSACLALSRFAFNFVHRGARGVPGQFLHSIVVCPLDDPRGDNFTGVFWRLLKLLVLFE